MIRAALTALALMPVVLGFHGCSQMNQCECRTDVGGVIDLAFIANDDGTPRFLDVPDAINQFAYSWNPCFKFSEGPTSSDDRSCTNVAVCQHMLNPDQYFTGGNQDTAEFITTGESEVSLQYTATGSEGFKRITTIKLVCAPLVKADLAVQGEIPASSGHYFLTLTSKYACPIPSTTQGPPPTTPAPHHDIFTIRTITFILCGILVLALVAVVVIIIFGSILLSRRKSADGENVVWQKPAPSDGDKANLIDELNS